MQGRPPRDTGELMWVRRVCGLLNRIREAIVGNFSSKGVAHLFVAAKMFSALPGVRRHLFATEVFHRVRLAVNFSRSRRPSSMRLRVWNHVARVSVPEVAQALIPAGRRLRLILMKAYFLRW